MPIVKEILTNEGEFQAWIRLPGKALVQLAIGGNSLVGNATHITKRGIEFKMAGQIQRRTQEELAICIMRFAAADLAVTSVPSRWADPHQLTDPASAIGQRSAVTLSAGAPLMDGLTR